jgi:hypothetical protein
MLITLILLMKLITTLTILARSYSDSNFSMKHDYLCQNGTEVATTTRTTTVLRMAKINRKPQLMYSPTLLRMMTESIFCGLWNRAIYELVISAIVMSYNQHPFKT